LKGKNLAEGNEAERVRKNYSPMDFSF